MVGGEASVSLSKEFGLFAYCMVEGIFFILLNPAKAILLRIWLNNNRISVM